MQHPYRSGLRDGIPVALGYFAVAVGLGLAAKQAGLSALQAGVASFCLNASAGEFAGFSLIAAGASYFQTALMTLIVNARYFLMSCALSQKLPPKLPLFHRLALGWDVTDEIFGLSAAVEGTLAPAYTYGIMTLALPGWSLGTVVGVVMGGVLPGRLVRALGVGLFGMFLAIVIPPTRRSRSLGGLVALSFAASYAVNRLPFLAGVETGVKTIALTLLLAGFAALLLPPPEGEAS